jgi:hypothetical protein
MLNNSKKYSRASFSEIRNYIWFIWCIKNNITIINIHLFDYSVCKYTAQFKIKKANNNTNKRKKEL